MSEMVKRVERALIHQFLREQPSAKVFDDYPSAITLNGCFDTGLLARAAIAAMDFPAMIEAALLDE